MRDWIRSELENWARWCRSGPWPGPLPDDHARSAEGRFASQWHLEHEGDIPHRPPPVFVSGARRVQHCYDTLFAAVERRVAVAEFVRPIASGRYEYGTAGAARRLHIPLAVYDAALSAVARIVAEEFSEVR